MGGENGKWSQIGALGVGSSPRGRGKPVTTGATISAPGLIPAWAGKTSPACLSTPPRRAHPRVGGENLMPSQTLETICGSSPRGRGKLILSTDRESQLGLIPARTGKTYGRTASVPSSTAHPRAGGENDPSSLSSTGLFGSSPRGRGKPVWAQQRRQMQRLIPARAGKTPCRARAHSCVSAHPRVGGENIDSWELPERHVGSSPRRRGKHSRRLPRPYGGGLIPAWAGKTAHRLLPLLDGGAHPRVGGENDLTEPIMELMPGSSPRGRGKQSFADGFDGASGLIPAWAGKTSSRPATTTGTWAHPRVGGENAFHSMSSTSHRGSSPRGRGKRRGSRCENPRTGLIPA